MQDLIDEFRSTGRVFVEPEQHPFIEEELTELEEAYLSTPTRQVSLELGRFLMGCLFRYENGTMSFAHETARKAFDIMNKPEMQEFYGQLIGPHSYQTFNATASILNEGDFINEHSDGGSINVIVQLGREYEGGQFMVSGRRRRKKSYSPPYGGLIVFESHFKHSVTPVSSGQRVTLVYRIEPKL